MKKVSVLVLLAVLLVSIVPPAVSAKENNFNYVDAFAKSILFYEANWCGPDAGNNRIKWRGPCHCDDGKDVGLDLTGGFHDCGDHVKFGLPQCASASTLAWAYYEFKDTFVAKGQDGYMLNILKHFCDYFIKCFPNKTTFYYQVGDGDVDHQYWGPPELQTYDRPAYYVATPENPGSDVAGDAAAALALMYLNYKDKDSTYAEKCLTYAKDLYDFGMTYRGNSKGQSYYLPRTYLDELMWGSIWLYVATNDNKYMDNVEKLMIEKGITGGNSFNDNWTQCWDYVLTGVFTKLATLSKNPLYKSIADDHIDYWQNRLKTTPAGLKYLDSWGVCKYPAAESMVQLVYYKYFGNQKCLDFAKSQIDYILGDNPNNMSYEVGFGDNYPKYPHHRAASGVLEGPPADEKKELPERHILYGALVGGADMNDEYHDNVNEYVYSETGLDYNAGFVGALAGMSEFFGKDQVPGPTPGIEGEPTKYYSEAKLYKSNSEGVTVDLNLYNIVTAPPQYEKGLSCKFFVDLSEFAEEGINPAKFTTKVYYSPAGAKISGIQPYDKEKNIYYVEITFPDSPLYARTYVQFCIYNYESKLWNSKNDLSTAGLTDAYAKVENIPIYKNGIKVYGNDPTGGEEVLYGDLNDDREINAIDLALLKKYILSGNAEGINLVNADLNKDGDINSLDFASLKLRLLGK
ncbi:glycoside hydrolase family 9 [Ruminiclostridium papyrosolvens DSM 2782]|uniref:cellulase n=1 Tax=Ruminiclostridium papyrosolvens DSM 2782 TaxID=588581 RepID=F1T8R4_9FIRM|nr:glycoside hydrolase family 9 protein [Ruminiclostridium papyrosolvens]EGD48896.1 glycoside hydrolase family 9 [Ruminiclostridium papyrosolvens DSM 2782]WES35380.1 glycoside hydrolase family 9 protein [Ruminiclostridium papyrosolvens DSM 2782]